MKRPPVDLSAMLTGTYLEKVGFINKFIKYWGTTTVNGVEVLQPYKFVYGGWGGGFLGGAATERKITTGMDYICSPIMSNYTDENGNEVTRPATGDNGEPLESCAYVEVTRERDVVIKDKHNWDNIGYNTTLATTRLLKHIKAYDQFKNQRWKGVRDMWLYLDPYKQSVVTAAETVDNFNKAQKFNRVEVLRLKPVTRTVVVDRVVKGVLTKVTETVTKDELVPVWVTKCKLEFLPEEVSDFTVALEEKKAVDGYMQSSYVTKSFLGLTNFDSIGGDNYEALRDELHEKYDTLFGKNLIKSRSTMLLPEDHTPAEDEEGGYKDTGLDMLTRYAFYGDKEKIKVTAAYTGTYIAKVAVQSEYDSVLRYTAYPTVVVEFELEETKFDSSSVVVTKIVEDFQDKGYIVTDYSQDSGYGSTRIEFTNVNKFYTWYNAGKYQRATGSPSFDVNFGYTNGGVANTDMWVVSGNKPTKRYHLKLSVLKDNSSLTLDEKIQLINEMLNTDYKEKDSGGGFLSFIIVVVVIVVAVLAAEFTGGKSLVAAQGVITATVAATYIVTFAAVIQIGAALAAATGYYDVASQLNGVSRMIAPIVMVAQIILLVDFVTTGYDKMFGSASQAGAETAANQAAGVMDLADDLAINTVGSTVERVVAEMIDNYTELSLKNAVKVAEMTADLYSRNQMEVINRLNTGSAKLQREMEELQQAKEASKYDDFAKLMINALMNPLSTDSAEFAYTDTPFERKAGSMHIGNVQATTVLGLYGEGTRTYVRNLV